MTSRNNGLHNIWRHHFLCGCPHYQQKYKTPEVVGSAFLSTLTSRYVQWRVALRMNRHILNQFIIILIVPLTSAIIIYNLAIRIIGMHGDFKIEILIITIFRPIIYYDNDTSLRAGEDDHNIIIVGRRIRKSLITYS